MPKIAKKTTKTKKKKKKTAKESKKTPGAPRKVNPPITSKSTDPVQKYISRTAYALHRRRIGLVGGNTMAINVAIGQGKFSLDESGLLDWAAADKAWPEQIEADEYEKITVDLPEGEVTYSAQRYNATKLKHEAHKAAMAELEYKQRKGELILARDVKDQAFRLARQVRDALIVIPDRLAPELAAETDVQLVENILRGEITKALEALTEIVNKGKPSV